MTAESIWAFVAISAVVIMTPGQDTALTIRNTFAGRRVGGIATALGVSLGQAAWALASAIGVVAFLVASEPVFAAVKFAGACYLIFLGGQSVYFAFRRTAPVGQDATLGGVPGLSKSSALLQGVLSNLGNPKMAIFFASLLPQFAPQGEGAFTVLISLGLSFCLMTFVWLTLYAFALEAFGQGLRRPAVRRWFEGVMGTALVALGLRLAVADQ